MVRSISSWPAMTLLFSLFLLLIGCGGQPKQISQLKAGDASIPGNSWSQPEAQSRITGSVPVAVYASELGYAGSSVKIDTLPSGNGFDPKLGLTYSSSQSEVGLAGVGWGLSGLSVITRCFSQVAFEGVTKGIDWSDSDAYCLDGKKLLLINGIGGADGAEYRLYQDEQKKIVYTVDHFEVFTKGGEHLFFGSKIDSREDGQNGKYFSYHLDKILDRSGNSINFQYEKDGGRLFLNRVSYGGNEFFSKPHYRSVSLVYEKPLTSVKRFMAGQMFAGDRLLKEIQIGGDEGPSWSYRLFHENQGPAALPVLVGIDQCFKDLACIPKTTFEYDVTKEIKLSESPAHIWKNYAPKNNVMWASNQSARAFVDLNNDGYLDLLALRQDSISYGLSGPNGPGPVVDQKRTDLAMWSPLVDMFSINDMNRDGSNDIVLFTKYGKNPGIYVAYWNGKGFDPLIQVSKAFGADWTIGENFRAVVDVDNDGWPDAIGSRTDGIHVAFNDHKGNLIGGEEPIAKYFLGGLWTYRDSPRYFFDVNGDGLVDILGLGDKSVYVALGTGRNFMPPEVWSQDFGVKKYDAKTNSRQLADLNGDGLADMVAFGPDGVDVALNTGKAFSAPEKWIKNLGYKQGWDNDLKERFVFDVNKDGFADLVGFRKSGIEVYLGNGKPNPDQKAIKTSPFSDQLYSWDTKSDHVQIEDLDGNDRTDFFVSLNEGVWKAEFNVSQIRLTAVRTALGEETRIAYKSLMDPAVYRQSKENTTDLVSVVGSFHVVSEIRKSNGLGGYLQTGYRYEDAFYHRDFLGFLGFGRRYVSDGSSGTETVETYSQDVSKWTQGALISHEVYSTKGSRIPISATTSIYEAPNLGQHPLHRTVLEKSSESKFFDEQGKLSHTVLTTKKYDDYQNTVLVETTSIDPYGSYKTRIDSTFSNDSSTWKIGLLTEAKSTSTASNSPETKVRTTRFEYDNDGHLLSEIEEPDSPLWIKKQYPRTHNSYGLVDSTVTSWGPQQGKGLGFTQTGQSIEYDARGFPSKFYDALGHGSSQVVVPETGLTGTITDPNGLSTSYTYDAANRVSSIRKPDGQTVAIEHLLCDSTCPANAVLIEKSFTQGFGQSIAYVDALGRTIRSVKSLARQQLVAQDYVYSEKGLLSKTSSPYFLENGPKFWTSLSYDERNRPRLITLPDGSTRETQYNGLQTVEIDALGRRTIFEKDSRGLLQAVTNAKGESLKYVYDPSGNLREVHDAGGNITLMEYDAFGRRTNLRDQTTGTSTTTYNALGLAASGARQGVMTENSYDALGRPLKKVKSLNGSEPLIESFFYDDAKSGVGKISKAMGPGSSVAYTYDNLSRPVEKSEILLGKSYLSSTQYDFLGRISQFTYPSGFAINYVYDEVSRLAEIRDQKSGKAFWSLGDIYPNGDIKEYRLGNGSKGFQIEDQSNNLIISESVAGADQTLQMARSYEHDAQGNLIARKDATTGVAESFSYDALDRLETFTGSSLKPVKMSYDQLSRITQRSDVGTYEYGKGCEGGTDSPFALKKVGGRNYCADDRGNIVQAGTRAIVYDVNSLPTRISDGQKLVTYNYGLGKAVLSKEETVNGEKALTRYVGGNFEIEETPTGVKQRNYVGDFLVVETEGSEYRENYLYKDYLGSTLAAADRSGAIVEKMDYDPFGQRRSASDLSWLDSFKPKVTSQGFTGHDHIEAMNLIHMKGRVYDPGIGLFLTPDPYVQDPTLVQNLNRYSYVINNPLSYTDPTGHLFEHAFKEVGRGLNSAGRALRNPGQFLESTWDKNRRAASDPRYLRLAGSVAISVLATIYAPVTASSAWYQTAAYYAAVGYTSSYVATNGDKKAALNGAVTAAAFNMVGSAFELAKDSHGALSSGMMAAKVAAHGVVGGLSATANGGRFESGFLSAGLSEAAGQAGLYDIGQVKTSVGLEIARSTAVAAIIGGSVSELTGGTFEQGALTAAMGRLFNQVAHAIQESEPKYYMWIEEPVNPGIRLSTAGDNVEPYGHLSLAMYSIGSDGQMTLYTSFSFAIDIANTSIGSEFPYIQNGTNYRDNVLNGPIVQGTAREFDFYTGNKIFNELVRNSDNRGLYSPIGKNCRDWTYQKFEKYEKSGKKIDFDPRKR